MINKVMIVGKIKLVKQQWQDKTRFMIITVKEAVQKKDVIEIEEKDLPVLFKALTYSWKVGEYVYIEGKLCSKTYFDESTKKNIEKIVIVAEQIEIFDVETLNVEMKKRKDRYYAEIKYDFSFDLN